MKKVVKSLLWTAILSVIAAIGISFTLKADIGIGSFNAISVAISELLHIKVGTIVFIANSSCVLVQLALLKKDFHWRQWLQIGLAFILGEMINVMMYTVLNGIVVNDYIWRVVLMLVGTTITCMAIAAIIAINLLVFPVESMCHVIAKKYGWQFGHVRQVFDVVFVVLALLMTFVFGASWTVREGTIISMFIFSILVHVFLQFFEKKQFFAHLKYD